MMLYVLYFLIFLTTISACYYVLSQWLPHQTAKRLASLRRKVHSAVPATASIPERLIEGFYVWLLRISPWLVKTDATTSSANPGITSDDGDMLRTRLFNAGVQSPEAPVAFRALQTLLTCLAPTLVLLYLWLMRPHLMMASMVVLLGLSAMLGYYVPEITLDKLIKRRQQTLFRGFPDALDLMRMCIQAGLGLDATLDRVGRETRLSCPPLSQEFALTGYELRAGASRSQALHHLSQRIGLSDIEGLVGTLIQSDRFGTSISESLQVYSDALRNKRRLIAQEAAAKLPIKLLIPLVFCLFPGLLTVLLGPAVINISRHLMPVLSGQH